MDMFAYRIVPVVVIDDPEDAEPLGHALMAGGLPVAEVTLRTDAAAESIQILSDIEGLTVGAGTIIKPSQVELAVEAGAKFLVSPGLRADIVREAQLSGKPILPGAVTPGEIMAAEALGVDTVLFFPAGLYGGAPSIEALAAPFADVRFVPIGGITLETMPEYLALSCVPAVGDSWMVPPELIAERNFDEITRLCREAVDVAASVSV